MSTDVEQYIRSICQIGAMVWDRGWAQASAGNISIDVSHAIENASYKTSRDSEIAFPGHYPECAGRTYLVTAAGSRFRELERHPWHNILLIRISETGKAYIVLHGGIDHDSRATSELATHLAVHASIQRHKRKETVVLHTHPTHLIALTNLTTYSNDKTLQQLLYSMHPEVPICCPDGIGVVAYFIPGSDELASHTVTVLETGVHIVIQERHGSLAVADSIEHAFDITDVVNKAAEVFLLSKGTGYELFQFLLRSSSELGSFSLTRSGKMKDPYNPDMKTVK